MTIVPSVLLAVILAFASMARADSFRQELRDTVYRDGRVQYVMTYQEDNHWKMQVFEAHGDELEDLILSEDLPNAEAASKRHAAYLKSIGYSQLDQGEADLVASPILEEPAVADSGDSLWTVTREWDDEMERKFSKWVSDSVDADFFKRYGIATDCADVVIGANWIFAYMNGLPIANTLSASGRLVGQMTMKAEWRDLPRADKWYQNQQFLAALNYVMSGTYTKSLGRDSYPIQITKESLIPGTHHLEFHEQGGHAQLVKTVKVIPKRSASIQTLNSTLPRAVRHLILKLYSFGDQVTPGTGFLRMKRIYADGGGTWRFKAAERYSTYSTEQYSDEFMNGLGLFSMAVNAHLCGNLELNIPEWKNTLKSFEQLILQRKNVVLEGYQACLSGGCVPGNDLYEEYSTPGRDDSLKRLIHGIVKTVELHEKAQQAYRASAQKTFSYMPERSLRVDDVITIFMNGTYDSDPRSPVEKRWGQN